MARKKHTYVPQEDFLHAAIEVGGGHYEDFAEYFNVHPSTAKRKLDGLVAQGKLDRVGNAYYLKEYLEG